MKTYHSGEVESLRAEVRALQMEVNHLQSRLADYEEADANEMRALWPYNWILSGVETVKGALESKRVPPKRIAPKRVATKRKSEQPRFDPNDGEARFSRMMM
ncbi:hypothetical protein EON83_27955 [bacterium]|nr:MAG: hypothetical protein EON83_27955 [bacterium]